MSANEKQPSNNPAIQPSQHTTFPLDSFLQRLELAGFYISPADRLRVLRLLDGLGTANLRQPEKLKTLLSPIIAHSKADQERFYELFDRYWEEVNRPWEMPPLPEPESWVKRFPGWLRWLMPVLMIAGLGWGIWKLAEITNGPKPKIFFKHPPTVRLGDTIHFENLSENIDSAGLRWEIVEPGDSLPELVDSQSFHLDFVVKNAGKNPSREVRLTSLNTLDDETGLPVSHPSSFRILCNFPPVIDTILAVREAKAGEPVRFTARLADSTDVQLAWDFGDGETATGSVVTHKFVGSGAFEVHLTATRTGIEGECQAIKNHPISVGRDKAILAAQTLWPDKVDPLVNFSWGTWILLGMLGLAMIWFWVKWAVRKPPPVPEAGEDLTAAAERFKALDKGPYFIPFRSQEGYVRVERELYRLADVLRMRQEGIRKNLDIPTSVNRTIADGGFPQLVTRADSIPTEYLFLVDEQSYGSHQSNLYRFLVKFLREREVLGEVYFFKNEPIRFWNDQHPDGMSPEQLRRRHPYHRLILLGDAHAMLDPNANTRPQVRPDVSKYFRQWKQRLLLTPMPVVSWTYREGALHGLFAVFPSDTEGIGEAIKFLERGMEEEDLPTYAAWCERLLEGRVEPDVNYRRWRTAAEHRDYLKGHPALYRWLCALAVYPKPDWNITLAIGHALGGAIPTAGEFNSPAVGMAVNYDNLLILSRIPWLQSGDLSPRLRKELLTELDPATERIAREAVQAELQAVESLVQGSHANQEQQINLAMQNFSLAPQSPETQAVIRQLQALQLLTPRHVAELNQTLERHVAQVGLGETNQLLKMSKVAPQTPDIQQFLEENKPKPEPPAKPFFTQNFWLASAATVLYLLIFLFAWNFGGTPKLAEWVGVDSTSTTACQPEFLYAGFLKKECVADSAVLYNNAGVEIYQNALKELSAPPADYPRANRNAPKDTTANAQQRVLNFNNRLVDAMANFQRALVLRPDYELAKSNLGKAHFDVGKAFYDDFLETPGPDRLPWAKQSFRSASAFDSVKMDATHGIGLVHFYQEQLPEQQQRRDSIRSLIDREIAGKKNIRIPGARPSVSDLQAQLAALDSAMIFYNSIMALDSSYFNSLKTYPHLQSLLFKKLKEGQRLVTVRVVDTANRPIVQVLVTSDNFQRQTDRAGEVQVEMTLGERRPFDFNKKGYLNVKQEIRPMAGNLVFTVKMEKIPQTPRQSVSTLDVESGKAPPDQQAATGDEQLPATDPNQSILDDDDGDGVPNEQDLCPNEVGTAQYKGCLPPRAPTALEPAAKAQWQLLRSTFIAEPKILKNRDFFDRLTFDGYDYQVTLNELSRDGIADFTLEKDLKQEARYVPPIPLPGLQKGGEKEFEMDGRTFRFAYLGQARRLVNKLTRDVAVYALYVQEEAGLPSDFPIPQMVFVKGGTFRMGCDDNRDGDCSDDEKPVHDVTLDDFSIGKYEVTNEEYAAFLNAYGSTTVKDGKFKGQVMIKEDDWGVKFKKSKGVMAYSPQFGYERHPVVKVSWYGANEYANWLSQSTDQTYRLPTEAQWKYAARGGLQSKNYRYSGSNDLNQVGWYVENSGGRTHPVGQLQSNEIGLYDMSGNLWEWCSDWYSSSYFKSQNRTKNPTGPETGSYKLLPAGSWADISIICRIEHRGRGKPGVTIEYAGFRLARAAR